MSLPIDKYITQYYFLNNPTWGIEDSCWKADCVSRILNSNSALHNHFLTKLANIPRIILCAINKDLGVRILGGETLFVLVQKATK